jgi:hypothetical protein
MILARMARSFNPFSTDFLALGSPDFYGPFWITTTLIFVVAFSSNMHNYLQVESFSPLS